MLIHIFLALIDGELLRLRALRKASQNQAKLTNEAIREQRWIFPQYMKKLRGAIRGLQSYPTSIHTVSPSVIALEQCWACHELPVVPEVKHWVESSIKAFHGVNSSEHSDSLCSIKYVSVDPRPSDGLTSI